VARVDMRGPLIVVAMLWPNQAELERATPLSPITETVLDPRGSAGRLWFLMRNHFERAQSAFHTWPIAIARMATTRSLESGHGGVQQKSWELNPILWIELEANVGTES
jgi:hypothetical protein